MEAVPTATLPVLAVPSGATHKRRKRHNDLDEREEELLRIQIRQHFTSSTFGSKATRREQERRRQSSSVSHETALLAGSSSSNDAFDLSSLGEVLAAPHKHFRLADAFQLLKRLLWVSDTDMNEEINENDPKIIAGKQFLKGVEAFSMLSENELAQLAGLSELRAFKAGDVVVDDERDADGLYIVLSGTASRYSMNNSASVKEEDGTSDSFGYQDHFGTIISPTEAAQSERSSEDETAVVATSEALECFWIPELVVRMLNVQPRMEYEFALVLHNHKFQRDAQHREQEAILARLLRAGLHVAVLANTRHTSNYIVLLLAAPLSLLAREDKLMTMERIVEHQSAEDATLLTNDDASHAETMGASDRIAAFASILTRSPLDKPPGVGLRGIENNVDAIVKDVFPLHDPSMTDFILSTWFKETHSASTKRLFLLRIKDYFGLRVAFFTAFERLYNAALIYPLNVGALLWIFWRWLHYRSYVKALGVYGLCVAFIWAPSFIKRWLRYQNSLLVEWNLLGATEVALPNPQFKEYVVETLNVAAPDEPPDYVEVKTYDHRKRWPKYAIFALFCFVCLVLLFLLVGFYVQWYIVAVMTPMCTDPRCPAFLDNPGGCEAHCHELFAQGKTYLFMQRIQSCAVYCDAKTFDKTYYRCDAAFVGCFETEGGTLGTARWFYILVQGIVLGLTLDIVFLAVFEAIASTFNAWENYATEQEKETRFIEKIFLFNWVGYFYWFILLAFCYVPNGDKVQAVIREQVDQNWAFTLNRNVRFSRYWVDGLISMDSAFVTPMIVTQALNLVINTFVPYLLRRAIVKARDSYHVKRERLSTAIQQRKQQHHRRQSPASTSRPSVEASVLTASTATEASGVHGSELNVLPEDADAAWLPLSDLATLERQDVAAMLAQREPVKAEQLDAAVHALFASLTTHDSHMDSICGGVSREDLDSYQATSYEWLDRVTRNLEASGQLKDDPPLQLIPHWACRQYLYTADRILEESSMPIYSPFADLLHLAIQFSYTIMFSVVWPFICLCSFARNYVALRFDAIKMTIDCKRPIPRRTIGIGRAWLGAFLFEILVAQVIVPGLFVYVSGQLDAFHADCRISETRYGPAVNASECGLDAGTRLQAFVALENIGIVLVFAIYLKKSDISHETSIKILEHSRKLKHHVRKSVRMIGETILVAVPAKAATDKPPQHPPQQQQQQQQQRKSDLLCFAEPLFAVDLSTEPPVVATVPPPLHRRRTQGRVEMGSTKALLDQPSDEPVEWREGVVAWVKNGRVKVDFSGGRQLTGSTATPEKDSHRDVWLASHERYTLLEPQPVRIFALQLPVLLASRKFGVWREASVVALDNRDRFGHELSPAPNEMHVRFVEAQNLRTPVVRHAVLMDPYCVLTVNGAPAVKAATSVKRSTLNPVWDEHVVLPLLETELYGSQPVADSVALPSAASSRAASFVGGGGGGGGGATGTTATLAAAAVAAVRPLPSTRRTLTVSVLNNDAFAAGECVGQVEIDLHQFRDGRKHRVLVPLAQTRRHVWTLDAIESVMRKQALGAAEYPMLGLPHVLLELQWIDTRLPTKVTVRVKGQPQDVVLSRKFCETHLCYGVDPDRVVMGGAMQ